jgi:protein TonB
LRARAQGTVAVRFTVRADGRVGGCAVIRSSGHAELDDVTCRLIEKRFRYRPALDASGRAVPAVQYKSFDWFVPAAL